MSWLRENWFDALLFVLLTAVVVAIVFFLIGINPFKRPEPTVETAAPAVETATEPPATPAASATAPATEENAEAGEEVTVLPLPSALVEEPAPGGAQSAPTDAAVASTPAAAEAPSKPSTPAPASPERQPQPGGRLYRVSVGAFTRPDYAVALAEKLEAEGYPVRIEVIGRVSRVVVGPYTSLDEAERAKEALATYEPQIYRGDTPEPKGLYLQVGAFKDLERARSLAAELKGKGYPVAVYYRDGWAKVWVGPLEPERLAEVRAELEEAGFQPVEVKDG